MRETPIHMSHIKPIQGTNVEAPVVVSATINPIPSGYELIKFRPYQYEYRDGKGEDDTLQIIAHAFNQGSESTLVRCESFPTFCFIQLPKFIGQTPVTWDIHSAALVVNSIRQRYLFDSRTMSRLTDDECEMLPYHASNFGFYKPLYYYCGDRREPMVRLVFKTKKALDRVRMMLSGMFEIQGLGSIRVETWENEIDPIRKYLSTVSPDLSADPNRELQVTHSCWTECYARRVPKGEGISTSQHEYIIDDWTTVKKIPDETCKDWMVYPGTMAFDIESYSNRHQMFPDANNASHVAYMISCIYERIESTPKDQKPKRYRYGIILGDCNDIPDEAFANTITYAVNTEEELVRMMGAIINYHDPEIITGYNILGFDYNYLNTRLGSKGCFWPHMSRLKDEDCYIESNSWSSGAYGHNDINMLKCSGRLSIDMFSVIKRDYKMASYGLNVVAKKFVDKEKHPITAQQMFVKYEEMINGIRAGPGTDKYKDGLDSITEVMMYCIQDSELVLDIINATHWWLGAVEMASIVGVNIIVLSTGGQQQRCESQLYHLANKMGYVLNTRVAPQIPFEGGAVQPPKQGKKKFVITIDFTSLYPSIIRWKNICYTTLIPSWLESHIPETMCNITPPINASNDYDPKKDDDDYDEEERKERYKAGGEKGVRVYKYVKSEVRRGVLPDLVAYLCNNRNRVKDMISQEYKKGDNADPLQLIVLDKRQNGLKVSANSFFGFLGVREGGKRPLLEGAMSITAWGRDMITRVIDFLKEKYNADIIYGDTDSAMVVLPQVKISTDVWYWGEKIAKDVTALFGDPVNMEFEKAFYVFISFKKKKYVGILCDKPDKKEYGDPHLSDDGVVMYGDKTSQQVLDEVGELIKRDKKGNPELFIRGVLTARRDNCAWARNIYTDIITTILMDTYNNNNDRSIFKKIVNKVCDYAEPLIKGQIPAQDLCISRALGANYKSNTYFMKVFSDELRKEGKPAQPGDRLEYLVMKRPGVDILGKRMMLKETYSEKLGTEKEEPIDYGYYLEKQIQSHVDQVISICFKDIIESLSWLKDRRNKRCKYIDFNEVVNLIVQMTRENTEYIKNVREAVDVGIEWLEEQDKLAESPYYIIEDDDDDIEITLPSYTPTSTPVNPAMSEIEMAIYQQQMIAMNSFTSHPYLYEVIR